MEAAGTVDKSGEGSAWQPGEQVMAIVTPMTTGRGAQSEYIVVPAGSVARIPDGADLQTAATIPMNGLTARRALDMLDLKPSQTLAVTGAAGAVGAYAIELAKAAGLRVVAVSSPKDEPMLLSLGADMFVPRGDGAAQAIRKLVPDGVDGLLDAAVIGRPILPAVKDGGKIACVRVWEGETERGISVDRVAVSDYLTNQAALDGLRKMASEGKLTLRVAQTFPPERAADAHRQLSAGGTRGRLVIVF
jgi:NADPH:quinone reductase-like Zn-dependent oxidoreductase